MPKGESEIAHVEENAEDETELQPEIQEARAMLVEFFELVRALDPESELSYLQLRDKSKMFRKLTASLEHSIELGGAPTTAAHIVESIVEDVADYRTADEFARSLTNPRDLVSGSAEYEFFTYVTAGLRETIQRDIPEAA